MDPIDLCRRGFDTFEQLVGQLPDDAWQRRTPCTRWTVRDLVNHVVYENRWLVPLLAGSTVEEVGDQYEGDLLGSDPFGAVKEAIAASRVALDTADPGGKVNLSYGEEDTGEYLTQIGTDHHIHGWDLAMGAGIPDRLDERTVAELDAHFDEARRELYVAAGAIVPMREVPLGDRKAQLLARFGRDVRWTPEMGLADRFHEALAAADLDTLAEVLAPDAAFESTEPPDGQRFEGRDAILAFFEDLFEVTTEPAFEIEEVVPAGTAIVARTRFSWGDPDGSRGHVRGMDLVRVRDGQIVELLAYVKG